MADSTKSDRTEDDEHRIEELTRELADKLRAMPNRAELTDFAVSVLRESAEDARRAEQARLSVAKAGRGDAFNPIAFAIPLFVVGAALCATGILVGPGLGIIGISILMGVYGLGVAVFSRRKGGGTADRACGR